MRPAPLLLLAGLAACGGADAGGGACPHEPGFDRTGVFKVRLDDRPTEIKRAPLAELNKVLAGVGDGKTQGLTSVEHRLGVRSRLGFSGSGPVCAWFEELVVELTPAAVEIVIPTEYEEGGCEYEAVLAHEREHETAHRELLAAAALDIRAALDAASWLPAKGNPLRAADRKTAEAELTARADKAVKPAYERFRSGLETRQAQLDAPGHYEWVRRRCKSWK